MVNFRFCHRSLIDFLLFISLPLLCLGIRPFPATGELITTTTTTTFSDDSSLKFTEAPEYRNGVTCDTLTTVHVAMTLDSEYLRGSIAAVHSVLRHSSCPENIFFHFIAAEFDYTSPRVLTRLVRNTFPSLNFKVYIFREDDVINLISSSIRVALENPLNYARNYLGDILDPKINRVIYLDSDVILVDDILKLWNITLHNNRVIGAPEYCHTNFTNYFTNTFWSDPVLPNIFLASGSDKSNKSSKNSKSENLHPCYFNTGVMVMDLKKWRKGGYIKKIEKWMEIQRRKRIYELGSLPPFLLVFAGHIEPIDHRWNQHGLGGDNVKGSCRLLHPGRVSLLHWSGKGKPWVRFDEKKPCPLDYVWKPYDLFNGGDEGGSGGDDVEESRRLDLEFGFSEYSNYLVD